MNKNERGARESQSVETASEQRRGIKRREFLQYSALGLTAVGGTALTSSTDACTFNAVDAPLWPPRLAKMPDECKFTLRLVAHRTFNELFKCPLYPVLEQGITDYSNGLANSGRIPERWEEEAIVWVNRVKDTLKYDPSEPGIGLTLQDLYKTRTMEWDDLEYVNDGQSILAEIRGLHRYMYVLPYDLPDGHYRNECNEFLAGMRDCDKYHSFLDELGLYTVKRLYGDLRITELETYPFHLISAAKKLGILWIHPDVLRAQKIENDILYKRNCHGRSERRAGLSTELDWYLKHVYRHPDYPLLRRDLEGRMTDQIEKEKCAMLVGTPPKWTCMPSDNPDDICELSGGVPTAGSDICP